MSVRLTINGTVFDYPTDGTNAGWGEDATGWAEAVTDILGTLVPIGFIPETTATINDNVTTFTNIPGATFDLSVTRSFRFTYTVQRTDGSTSYAETGVIEAVYGNGDWDYSISLTGDAGMEFQVTSDGRIQYKSSSVGGVYSGNIKFFANVITA